MNAGGHIAVAAGLGDGANDSGYLLGAALPDLSTMGGFRLLGATRDPSITTGIRLHHQTDDAFHRHPWFTDRNRSLNTVLLEAGVGRGAARACAHVGIELLLDGELLDDPTIAAATDRAFAAIGPSLDALAPLVLPSELDGWRRHLARLAEHQLPADYADPRAVAHRLFRILARRRRLALDEALVETVASALAAAQPSIAASASSLLAGLKAALQAGPTEDRGSVPS